MSILIGVSCICPWVLQAMDYLGSVCVRLFGLCREKSEWELMCYSSHSGGVKKCGWE